ncbi:HD domain-containing phosphohydrolase [Vibrio sp. 99-70-13A1]|uniref:HD domain-containing phosphohydrolase n=1 Tax=Vibrio sp. 99-70-13A1 TaxID=2607601 RepID=UPI001493C815|nr:HD domain-containing phosphohydrolase [Vibrio sp. 99-70-13A1]NOH95674.1 HD domain-containing protein [Vibrio sp. 99-70-13A1]
MKKRRYPLSIHITSLFLVLTTLVGAVLISISYRHSQELLSGTVQELSKEHSNKLESVFKQTVAPVLTTLDFMAVSSFIRHQGESLEQKPWLASIHIIFKQNPNLVALFYTANDGSFTIFRPLTSNKHREANQAPSKATMMINSADLTGRSEIVFLDGTHKQVGHKITNDNTFDPRERPWFISAQVDGKIRLSEPYMFHFLKTAGITLSRRSADGGHVIGADFTLDSLSSQIGNLAYSKQTRLALFDQNFNLLGQHQLGINNEWDQEKQREALKKSVLSSLFSEQDLTQTIVKNIEYNLNEWALTMTPVPLTDNVTLMLAEATPQNDLLADLISMRDKQVTVALGLLAVCFILVWFVAHRLSMPLQNLMQLTDNIARFDFKKTHYPKSMIKEVSNLTQSIELMEHTLHDLLQLLRDTASNQDFNVLAKTIAHQSYLVTKAETIVLFVQSDEADVFEMEANHAIIPFKADINEFIKDTPWLLSKLKAGETIHLNRDDNALKRHQNSIFNSDLYLFPLMNREGVLVGMVAVGYERSISQMQLDKHAFLRELLSFAEIAKDNIDQLQQQKDMLNAFIELIASAIDTKSPYTGGHCQRVPELTKWIAEITEQDKRYFPHFSLDKKQWEELTLASWLHDCGKVTTPEYVVDKATKLETIYDRIHEIRMRFELLKQQAETDYWQAIAKGDNKEQQQEILEQTHKELDEEFTFVAQCNLGGEFMEDEKIERLDKISKRRWKRTLDDQLGVSWVEKQRHDTKTYLPKMEPLLADKVVHKVPWEKGFSPMDVWTESFVLQPTDVKYDRGELHNLKVRRGTLNDEERFMINDHIVQTLTMLNKLPYPEHLKNIPDIAGGHHERVDGKGYPRGLNEEQLSIPARAMAIADVFEALTSSDRPYKKAKSLDESLNIMTNMATTGHIDPKLYVLFLEHGIDQRYAEHFLDESQHSDVDRFAHIQKVKEYIRLLF